MKTSTPAKTFRSIKQVRFAETSTLFVTRPKTLEELKSCWYAKDEIKQFKQSAVDFAKDVFRTQSSVANAYIIQSLELDRTDSHHYFSGVVQICGLEHALSDKIYQALATSRYLTINDVLEEQARQKRLEESNIDMLAAVSMRASLFPKLWRRNIAVINAFYE
ncbi:hypothetical protein ACHAWX_002941 [Stephanocyclus meneghinianus]